jgi:hypothetical protein
MVIVWRYHTEENQENQHSRQHVAPPRYGRGTSTIQVSSRVHEPAWRIELAPRLTGWTSITDTHWFRSTDFNVDRIEVALII